MTPNNDWYKVEDWEGDTEIEVYVELEMHLDPHKTAMGGRPKCEVNVTDARPKDIDTMSADEIAHYEAEFLAAWENGDFEE